MNHDHLGRRRAILVSLGFLAIFVVIGFFRVEATSLVSLQAAFEVIEFVATAFAVLACVLLFQAIVARYLDAERRPRPSTGTDWLAAAVVASAVAVAFAIAAQRDVPRDIGPAAGAAILALVVLTIGDARFWRTAGTLFALMCVIGLVFAFVSASSYVEVGGEGGNPGLYASRMLISEGGLRINPSYDGWWMSAIAVAVLRFGLPLGLGLTCMYQASLRTDLRRAERLGLQFVSGWVVASFFGPPAIMLFSASGALQYGAPIALSIAAIVGTCLVVATLGPGAIDGLAVGGRTLTSFVPGGRKAWNAGQSVLAVHEGVTYYTGRNRALGLGHRTDGADDGPSIASWAWGGARRRRRLFVAFVLLSIIAIVANQGGTFESVSFEPIAEVQSLGFDVETVRASDTDDLWLIVGTQGERVALDTTNGSAERLEPIGGFVAAEAGSAPGPVPVLLAQNGVASIVAAAADGTLEPISELTGVAPDAIRSFAVDESEVFTVVGRSLQRRSLDTGEVVAELSPIGSSDSIVGIAADTVALRRSGDSFWLVDFIDKPTMQPVEDPEAVLFQLRPEDPDRGAIGRGWFGPGRRPIGADREHLYTADDPGAILRSACPDCPTERREFHYDEIHAIIPSSAPELSSYLVASDPVMAALNPGWPTTAVIATWDGGFE